MDMDASCDAPQGFSEDGGFFPIRARISDDVDEDYEGDVEEEGSFTNTESYDSASEPTACDDIINSDVSFVETSRPSEAASSAQESALMQLNQLSSGFASLDTSFLENTDWEGFRNRVLSIAKANSIPSDNDKVQNILTTLLPIAGNKAMGTMSTGDGEASPIGKFSGVIPVAKPTAEDDEETDGMDEENHELCQDDMDSEASNSGLSEKANVLGSALGLRVRCSDEESKEQREVSIVPRAFSVRAAFSSGQEDETLKSDDESDGSAKQIKLLSSNNADVKEGQLSPTQASIKSTLKAEEGISNRKSNAPDSLSVVAHLVSSSDDSDHAAPSFKSPFTAGDHNRRRESLDSNISTEAPLDVTGCMQQDLSQNWQSEGKGEEAEFKVEKVDGSVSSTPSAEDSVVGDFPVNPGPFDLPGPASVGSRLSSDAHADTNVQKMADLQDGDGNAVQGKFQSLNEERNIISAVGEEENTAMELKDNGSEKRGAVAERRFESGIDDDKIHNDLIHSALPVAESVNSKSTADPTSDTPSLRGAGHSLAAQPFGLGRFTPTLEHAPRAVQRSLRASAASSSMEREVDGPNGDLSRGNREVSEKLQSIRIKFLRLAHRLGQPPHNAVIAQVLYRLGLAEQLRAGHATDRPGSFSLDRAIALAEEQEAAGQDDLDFVCTIMLLGKSGVGKSATINALFDEVKVGTDAYSPATKKVQIVTGMVHGVKLRIIDTPGLLGSIVDQRHNRKIMSSVKRFIKKSPPDIVLYFDRLDMQSRDYGDLPLLQTITNTFGAAVWFNAIVALTHAASAPPDGINGEPINYEMFVAQRSHVVQQTIRRAAGDMRLMNPVSLIENHRACRANRAGQKVLPNGHVWKGQLLLLCFASKILAEANSLLKLQDSNPVKPSSAGGRGPPLPYLLSTLLQSRAKLRMPDDQGVDDEEFSDDSESNDMDSDGEEDYDDLPPFRRLTKEELQLLDKEQRKIYGEELEDRERLFMKKQLKEERKRRRERRRAQLSQEASESAEDRLEEENSPAEVPVIMPDMALPPSFSSDNPTYRYRCLDSFNQWLIRPVLETNGWDHDCGYDGLNVEKLFVISHRIPASISGQLTKDKKDSNLHMECAASIPNGDGKVTLAGLDVQTIGRDLACTVRSETMFNNFKKNKTTCGLAMTMLGDVVATGVKIEDKLQIGKRLKVMVNTGALTGKGDVAYGGSLEASIRDPLYPIEHSCSSFGLSVMNWHGDLAIGGNLLVQIQSGKNLYIGRANLNNRGAGQVSIRMTSSEQVQLALVGLIPIVRAFLNGKVLNKQG